MIVRALILVIVVVVMIVIYTCNVDIVLASSFFTQIIAIPSPLVSKEIDIDCGLYRGRAIDGNMDICDV